MEANHDNVNVAVNVVVGDSGRPHGAGNATRPRGRNLGELNDTHPDCQTVAQVRGARARDAKERDAWRELSVEPERESQLSPRRPMLAQALFAYNLSTLAMTAIKTGLYTELTAVRCAGARVRAVGLGAPSLFASDPACAPSDATLPAPAAQPDFAGAPGERLLQAGRLWPHHRLLGQRPQVQVQQVQEGPGGLCALLYHPRCAHAQPAGRWAASHSLHSPQAPTPHAPCTTRSGWTRCWTR